MKNINLLIVDDKIENIISLTALLNDIENINIISSQDPNEALRLCYKQNIDIALVDVQMPEIKTRVSRNKCIPQLEVGENVLIFQRS